MSNQDPTNTPETVLENEGLAADVFHSEGKWWLHLQTPILKFGKPGWIAVGVQLNEQLLTQARRLSKHDRVEIVRTASGRGLRVIEASGGPPIQIRILPPPAERLRSVVADIPAVDPDQG